MRLDVIWELVTRAQRSNGHMIHWVFAIVWSPSQCIEFDLPVMDVRMWDSDSVSEMIDMECVIVVEGSVQVGMHYKCVSVGGIMHRGYFTTVLHNHNEDSCQWSAWVPHKRMFRGNKYC